MIREPESVARQTQPDDDLCISPKGYMISDQVRDFAGDSRNSRR